MTATTTAPAPVVGSTPLVDLIGAHAVVGFRTSELSDVISCLRGEHCHGDMSEIIERLSSIRDEAHAVHVTPTTKVLL